MTLQSTTPSWEQHLITLAQDALCVTKDALRTGSSPRINKDQVAAGAIAAYEAVTAEHSRSFYLATSLLPREKRRAMRVLYAFCRTADYLVDGNGEQLAAKLFESRIGYAEQLLDGMERDLVQLPQAFRYSKTEQSRKVYSYLED